MVINVVKQKLTTANEHAGYIYFIKQTSNIVKIGRSKDPKSRLSTYKHLPAKVIHVIYSENYMRSERLFHSYFKEKQVDPKLMNSEREWFYLTDEDVKNIKNHRYPEEIAQSILEQYYPPDSFHLTETLSESSGCHEATMTIPCGLEQFVKTHAFRLNQIVYEDAPISKNEEEAVFFYLTYVQEKGPITQKSILDIERLLLVCKNFEYKHGKHKSFMEFFLEASAAINRR
jgi:hypothetical protein